MKTATIRELRNDFSKLEAWLAGGEEIRIERRGEVIALLVPVASRSLKTFTMPDFEARLKAIWGDRVFSQKEVDEMRSFELGEDA